jgi:four helix bundle protein
VANVKQTFDLEARAKLFARDAQAFVKGLAQELIIFEGKQLVRSAGSVAANYIKANEALSRKDLIMRLKLCRQDAKESRFWLNLIYAPAKGIKARDRLLDEATQLMKTFGSLRSEISARLTPS